MTTFLVVCGEEIDIGRRVVTFLEEGAPNFYKAKEELGRDFFSLRPGVGAEAGVDRLGDVVYQICLHHDSTWNSPACFEVLKSRGFSSHLLIEANGVIYQPLDMRDSAWHAGDINDFSIGIDLNCMANYELLTETEKGRRYAASRGGYFTGVINGAEVTGTGYTEAQYESLVAIIKALAKLLPKLRLFPPLDAAGDVIQRKIVDYASFSGFLGHLHVLAKKWDPGPGFDWRRVLIGLHGNRNTFPVDLPGVKPLSKVFSTAETQQIAESYYVNNELGYSGYYPITRSQSWHSGVHFNASRGQPVRCMARGTIVAARNSPDVELGSPSFVLVRHSVRASEIVASPDGAAADTQEPVEKTWYSLYMHLRFMSESARIEERPRWYRELGSVEVSTEKRFIEPRVEEESGDRRPRTGRTFRDLRVGRIVLMDQPVEAGEVIGYVGVFGNSPESQRDLIHVETFSVGDDPLFEPTRYPDIWRAIEADEGSDSLADIDQIWRPIFDVINFAQNEEVKLKPDERILKGSEIQDFFQGDSREKIAFRGYVCRHVSEWSDNLDWIKTANIAVGWQWETKRAYDTFIDLWSRFIHMKGDHRS
ncbi:MAG: N-acetylmuramoyl-L-alanine amidase, partial [Myxococcota bacterium]